MYRCVSEGEDSRETEQEWLCRSAVSANSTVTDISVALANRMRVTGIHCRLISLLWWQVTNGREAMLL